MKKFIFAILPILVATQAWAAGEIRTTKAGQVSQGYRWGITPVAGGVATNFSFDSSSPGIQSIDSEGIITPTAGVNVDFPLGSSYLTLSSGLMYSRNSTEYIVNSDFGGTNQTRTVTRVDMDRLSIPLTLSLFPFEKRNGFFVKGGLAGNILLGGTESSNFQNVVNGAVSSESGDLSSDYNDFALDAVVSAGVKFPGKYGIGILIEAQYQHGISKIAEYDSGESISTQSVAGFLGLNIAL